MKANSRILRCLVIGQLLVGGGAWAQVADPTKALIGTWEGQIEIASNSARTITINSVTSKGDGEWVARGRYAIAGSESKETTGGQAMSVTRKENDIYLEFVVGGSKNPVTLKLVGETKLEGTINMVVGGRGADRRFKLEKKAAESK